MPRRAKDYRTRGRLVYSFGAIYLAETLNGEDWPIVKIALMDREEPETTPTERDANARRLVECWNAFEDVGADTVLPALAGFTDEVVDCLRRNARGECSAADVVEDLSLLLERHGYDVASWDDDEAGRS